jgi:hypothetical protein
MPVPRNATVVVLRGIADSIFLLRGFTGCEWDAGSRGNRWCHLGEYVDAAAKTCALAF